ncbi:hypothetical protein ACFQI7_12260 [Paenibacillus allorhizosphaerae]|uniref:Uncharacterized protein n=1 Tax=Paenibacillus allorhizosphaerae TaxID=2849866 RepID=A0ABM8VLL2_9BACL|nr:hypothetical protein [Paenibacillus allorhizosphaerae]CAG7648686.1 hypothetical protein PAECIP111802_04291 [Paenibacillus allorhizosphaerae]
MKIRIKLSVAGELVKEADVDVADMKMEELTDEEKENAVEIIVRDWANRNLHIEWEAEPEDPS